MLYWPIVVRIGNQILLKQFKDVHVMKRREEYHSRDDATRTNTGKHDEIVTAEPGDEVAS